MNTGCGSCMHMLSQDPTLSLMERKQATKPAGSGFSSQLSPFLAVKALFLIHKQRIIVAATIKKRKGNGPLWCAWHTQCGGRWYCDCPSRALLLPYSQALHLSHSLGARQANSLQVLLPHAMILPPHELRLRQPCPADLLQVAQKGGH